MKDRNIYAFLTILNIEKLGNEVLKEKIRSLFVNSLEEGKQVIISSIFTKHKGKIGLFLNQRVINFPFCVVSDTYEQLLEDKKFIDETTDLTEEDKKEWDFTYIVYYIPITPKVHQFYFLFYKKSFYKSIELFSNDFVSSLFVLFFLWFLP